MDFYTQSAASAFALIKAKGRSLPIRRVTNTPDPVTGDVSKTETAGNLVAVILPAKSTGNQAVSGGLDNSISEALTKAKSRFVLAAAQGVAFEPDADDILTFEGADWRVIGCTPLSPAGTAVIFKIGAVRA